MTMLCASHQLSKICSQHEQTAQIWAAFKCTVLYLMHTPRGKVYEAESDFSDAASYEVKNTWSFTFTFLY